MDSVNKAKQALGGAGLSYTEGTLEQFELANKPGALAELAGKLAKKGINIDCAYAMRPCRCAARSCRWKALSRLRTCCERPSGCLRTHQADFV